VQRSFQPQFQCSLPIKAELIQDTPGHPVFTFSVFTF